MAETYTHPGTELKLTVRRFTDWIVTGSHCPQPVYRYQTDAGQLCRRSSGEHHDFWPAELTVETPLGRYILRKD